MVKKKKLAGLILIGIILIVLAVKFMNGRSEASDLAEIKEMTESYKSEYVDSHWVEGRNFALYSFSLKDSEDFSKLEEADLKGQSFDYDKLFKDYIDNDKLLKKINEVLKKDDLRTYRKGEGEFDKVFFYSPSLNKGYALIINSN